MRSLICIFSSASVFSQSAFTDDVDSYGINDIIDKCPAITDPDCRILKYKDYR